MTKMINSAIAHYISLKKLDDWFMQFKIRVFIGLAIMVQGVCEQLHHALHGMRRVILGSLLFFFYLILVFYI